MEKAERHRYALCGVLLTASAVLLAWTHFEDLGLWLFALAVFACVTLLNDFLLRESHGWNRALTAVQCVLPGLAAYALPGLGSFPLALLAQAGFSGRYGKKASALLSLALYTLMIAALCGSPYRSAPVAGPAIVMGLSALAVQFLLFELKDAARLRRELESHIAQLQSGKKALGDRNAQMLQESRETEKAVLLRERDRMSKQIHDTLGHTLTAVSVQLGAAEMLLGKDPEQARIKIANAKAQTREGLASIKEALAKIDKGGLQFKERLAEAARKAETNMNCKILSQVFIESSLPPGLQDLLLSALQEGVTNGVRHGGATAFVFRLDAGLDGVRFTLEDNGKGCKRVHKGFGLTAMERQAQACGGALEAVAMQGAGFTLKLNFPNRRASE